MIRICHSKLINFGLNRHPSFWVTRFFVGNGCLSTAGGWKDTKPGYKHWMPSGIVTGLNASIIHVNYLLKY